ncbi:DUF1772 domain-containing protein [Agromyces archimandritae]|uniref:DUF1772 domain-containing protein n=1 Tax=Agromyces archimandritae TaxID=2781962 RepID=A0A975FK99_9MICO|nr:anthrone oxygenase family protein [Agromyces archimandritae]QTX03610.1 DUF1772 domain-containing protein [Agromyces archimandritae]
MDAATTVLTVVAAIGSGLAGGVFFAFSSFVMAGLDRAGDGAATPVMQGINATAVRPPLMLLLFGTMLVAIVAGVLALIAPGAGSPWIIAAGIAYLLGPVLTTGAANVPLNNALDRDEIAWRAYLPRWMRWNHVRTLGGAAAAAGYAIALVVA